MIAKILGFFVPTSSAFCKYRSSAHRQTDRQTDRQRDRQKDRQTDTQTDRQTDRHSQTHTMSTLTTTTSYYWVDAPALTWTSYTRTWRAVFAKSRHTGRVLMINKSRTGPSRLETQFWFGTSPVVRYGYQDRWLDCVVL